MKGYSTTGILNPFFQMPTDRKELEKVYRTLAKSADQRLVRLEAYEHDQGFQTATKWAYARAQHDIKQWSGSQATRFNTAPPESDTDLLSKIQDIEHFLLSKTSTKQGIISVYKKKADSMNATGREKFGKDWKNVTWKDMAQFYDSTLYEKIDSKYGSSVIMMTMSIVEAKKDEIITQLKLKKDINIKVEDEEVQGKINDILSQYTEEVQELIKK